LRVIGAAGHVDHGKSTLVRALSGIDPDRLKEEKARGMTIDLGFAWFDLAMPGSDGIDDIDGDSETGHTESVGIIDVPGHIDFIKNMLAGIGGIDAAMLVIAADEGVMPQTREHLAILDLLAVPFVLVVLSKIDRAEDADWLDLVELDVHDLLAATRFAGAPVVRVSAVTGEGLALLRQQLARALQQLPPRRNRARPRLPIDRVFSLSGLGTIVTGTLSDGVFALGDSVEILPSGSAARVRGLQTHKRQVEVGEPGSRVAMNLSGVGVEDLHRGDVVAKPGTLQASVLIDVRFRLLPDAPKPLAHNQRVDFFSGAAEVTAYARVLGAEQLEQGNEGFLQLRLDRPVVVLAGDRFILRQPSPSQTLGGGIVLNPVPRRRWRRYDRVALARLETLSRGAPEDIMLQALTRQPLTNERELLRHVDLPSEEAKTIVSTLRMSGAIREVSSDSGESLFIALETWQALRQQLGGLLTSYHRQYPLRRGMARGEVRSRLQAWLPRAQVSVRTFNALIAAAQADGVLQADDQTVWLRGYEAQLNARQAAAANTLLSQFADSPYAPPNMQESMQALGGDTELFGYLLDRGFLVRLGGDVLLGHSGFEAMTSRIQQHLREHGMITLAEVRDLFGTSRKYAQAVLEEMDARRITRREGEGRVLRA
jgi:selenocysteine-specific elongation factor